MNEILKDNYINELNDFTEDILEPVDIYGDEEQYFNVEFDDDNFSISLLDEIY